MLIWIANRFLRFKICLLDIKNYLFLWRVIFSNRDTIAWKQHKLLYNWFGSIGTIINLKQEDMIESEQYRVSLVHEEARPIHRYLDTLRLSEMLSWHYEQIPGHVSYKIEYKPLFRVLSLWYLIKCSIVGWLIFQIIKIIQNQNI